MSVCCGSKQAKNPCMICKRPVSKKTGLQCQGSCKSWIHFTCCDYTPGKIKNIKAKVIKVRCPCPGCTTEGPKEVVAKESSFTCINKICPANNPTKRNKPDCPISKVSHQTSTHNSNVSTGHEWPGIPCGASCKKNARELHIGDRRNHPLISSSHSICPVTGSGSSAAPVMPSISIVEHMCDTVGLLSEQLNQLMIKMTNVLTPHKNPCPCRFAQNPRR